MKPPCLPFIGIYLKDLSWIEESMDDYEGPDKILINYSKCRLIMKIYSDIRYKQSICYADADGLDGITLFFNDVVLLPDDKMRQLMMEYNQV